MSGNNFFEEPDGARIGYKVLEPANVKDEVPLVMITGEWCTKEDFMDLDDALAKDRKVILIDNRGMGESTPIPSDVITIDLMAQDTIALIKHLGIKRFSLLGWSMGGHIAICIALNVPSDLTLEKMIICGSPLNFETSSFLVKLSKISESDVPKTPQEHKDYIMKALEKVCTDYLLAHPEKFDRLAELKSKTYRPLDLLRRQWGAIEHKQFSSELQTIKVPTLVVHGEADGVVPIQDGELLASKIPTAKFVKIPNVGHRFWFATGATDPLNGFLLNAA